MKTALALLLISFFILTGCSKGPEVTPLTAEEKLAKLLTADGNRLWHLKAVYQNDTLQTLTASQLTYTKTFTLGAGQTSQGSFTDNDLKGTWKVMTGSSFYLEFYSAAGKFYHLDCNVLSISETKLDFSYPYNMVKNEEVYYAY
ncbi:MAG: hypothetical protein JO301_16240, partial [Chitinophagaceae bacterium]|nr:hypothetical protein [Chitinophagaceae bacterium]